MVEAYRSFATADRTGSWRIHLYAVSENILKIAAAGQLKNFKSAFFYSFYLSLS